MLLTARILFGTGLLAFGFIGCLALREFRIDAEMLGDRADELADSFGDLPAVPTVLSPFHGEGMPHE